MGSGTYTMLLSSTPHHHLRGTRLWSRKGKQNSCSKDRGGDEEPPMAQVQVTGQSVVTSFLMTFPNKYSSAITKSLKNKLLKLIATWTDCQKYNAQ